MDERESAGSLPPQGTPGDGESLVNGQQDQQQNRQQAGMGQAGSGGDPVAGGAHGGEMDAGSQATEQHSGSGQTGPVR